MEKETELFEGEIPYSDAISESLSNFFNILGLNLNFETDSRLPQMVLPHNVKLYALSLAITFLKPSPILRRFSKGLQAASSLSSCPSLGHSP